MSSPNEIAANCPPLQPENVPAERGSKKQKQEEFPGGIQCRSSDEIDDNEQDVEETNDDDDDYNVDDYDGDVVLMNQYKLMYKQAQESEGFDVTARPYKYIPGAATYMHIEEDTPLMYGQVKKCLAYAIEDHNKRVKDDEKIEVLDIVRALVTGASIYVFFITINARLISTKKYKVYQIRVVDNMIRKKITVNMVRPKPGQ